MSITNIILWTCDLCGAVQVEAEATDVWSDTTVVPPKGWDTSWAVLPENRKHPAWDICDACPDCVAKAADPAGAAA